VRLRRHGLGVDAEAGAGGDLVAQAVLVKARIAAAGGPPKTLDVRLGSYPSGA
jgi:hypothetical protein